MSGSIPQSGCCSRPPTIAATLTTSTCDGNWEAEFCRAAEANPRVRAYVKNQGPGFEVPYLLGATPKKYLPDIIVRVDDGHGGDDLLNLVVEIKGYRGEDAKDKANTMDAIGFQG